MVTDEALCKRVTPPIHASHVRSRPRLPALEYGNEIGVQSNAVSSTIDFFRQVSESQRRKPTSPRR